MPFPLAAAAAGAGLLGQGINAWAQGANNRKQRNWNWRMYQQQRTDALADWNMQNEYNSPKSQMARFTEAGLNKNLIYGSMTDSPMVRSGDSGSYHPEAPQFDTGSIMAAYFEAQQKPLQTDNLKKAVEIATEQVKLVQAQTAATLAQGQATATGTDRAKFDLALQQSLLPLTVETAGQQLKKLKADTTFTIDQNIRAAVQNVQSLKEGFIRMSGMLLQNANTEAEKKNIDQRLKNMQQDNRIRQFDEDMLKTGARPGDALWERKAMEFLSKLYEEYFGDKTPGKNYPGGPLEGIRQRALELRKKK